MHAIGRCTTQLVVLARNGRADRVARPSERLPGNWAS